PRVSRVRAIPVSGLLRDRSPRVSVSRGRSGRDVSTTDAHGTNRTGASGRRVAGTGTFPRPESVCRDHAARPTLRTTPGTMHPALLGSGGVPGIADGESDTAADADDDTDAHADGRDHFDAPLS